MVERGKQFGSDGRLVGDVPPVPARAVGREAPVAAYSAALRILKPCSTMSAGITG